MKVNKGLGKGLSALFTDTSEDYSRFTYDESKMTEEQANAVYEIELDKIFANPNQPRKAFDEGALKELADSISVHGVITPIVLNKADDGKYMIIAGERRFRASKLAGKATIPAIIRDYDERQIKEISLIENLQREDLNPIEAATAMQQLMKDYDMTQEELSTRIGKSRSAVANTLRLLTLSPQVIKLVESNKLSAGHARALVTLPANVQESIATKAVKDKLSVRDVEQAVKDYYNPPEKKKAGSAKPMSVELRDMIVRMQRDFGTKVQAIGNDKKGRIYIDYYTRDDLDRIIEILDLIEKHKK
ncbi:MAG: ParB/RepB/Spo0J family partition protein [Clostridia bacterium]|nr:ParB/RepB/Spo0J family partition protein [Clostridia bacterium]